MEFNSTVIGVAVIALATLIGWAIIKFRWIDRKLAGTRAQCQHFREQAELSAEQAKKEKLLEARDQVLSLKSGAEDEIRERRRELDRLERKVESLQSDLAREKAELGGIQEGVDRSLADLHQREAAVRDAENKLEDARAEQLRRLESVAGMTADEAKRHLMGSLEQDARRDAALLAKRIEDEARERSDREARKMVTMAIQRCAAEHVVETTVSVVDLPTDDMKGRIIGREGRNIRALEQATGVDLIVDDTPEAIILSAFDPLRRQIAKLAIESLIKDGRIHPARIEEVVGRVQREMEKNLLEEGEQIAFELGIHDMAPELLQLMGRLKYRTSYGQNVLYHSREVAYLAGLMARELGADVDVCLRAGFLHDVGKAVDREMEGTHLQLGVNLARKNKESPEVIHAIEAHHFDVEFESLEAVLVQAGDAISAARPGARREVLENYVKRLERLESLASSFEGVSKAFALQAGREVRIIVESSQVSDEQAFWLTKDIAKKIEAELQYPGQIKVTLIREMRVVDYAK